MPQANSIPFETANLDLISDRPRKVPEYRFPSRERERTYSLPNRPEAISFNRSNSQSDEDESDSDPLTRMRVNLERSTFLLSRLKVGLSSKPEAIEILPPASDYSSDEYPSTHHPHPLSHSHSHSSYTDKPKRRNYGSGRKADYAIAPSTMERKDSTSTNTSTQFSLEVSNYNYVGPNGDGRDDHGSEFHQLVNHGRLHNPSRGTFRAAPPPKRIISRPMTVAPFPPASEPPSMEGRYGLLKGRRKQSSSHGGTTPLDEEGEYEHHRPLSHTHTHTRTMSTSAAVPHPFHPPGLGSSSSGRGHGHGRSVSVSHGVHPPSSSSSNKPTTNLRRVRFEM